MSVQNFFYLKDKTDANMEFILCFLTVFCIYETSKVRYILEFRIQNMLVLPKC